MTEDTMSSRWSGKRNQEWGWSRRWRRWWCTSRDSRETTRRSRDSPTRRHRPLAPWSSCAISNLDAGGYGFDETAVR